MRRNYIGFVYFKNLFKSQKMTDANNKLNIFHIITNYVKHQKNGYTVICLQ